jgi:hypothetical protein
MVWRRRYVKLRSRRRSLADAPGELVELSGVIGDVGLGMLVVVTDEDSAW